MRSFFAFLKKELLESARSGKLMILSALFIVFGIMNPAIAKLTPWLIEMMAEELAESGMTVTEVAVDALTSWTQFFKNVPMALIAFVFIYGGVFTSEYGSGTLVLVLTKGLERHKVVLSKAFTSLFLWSAGYFVCFGITYAYNFYYWDNSIAIDIIPAVIYWWLFGVFTLAMTVLFSVIAKSYVGVLLPTGGCVFAIYLISLIPKLTKYMPTSLMNGMNILTGAVGADEYIPAAVITAVLSVSCIAVSIPIFNKKEI